MELFLAAPDAIQIHIATVLVAVAMTLIILPLRKGTGLHRIAGWVWVVSMMTTAIVSLWIHEFDTPYWFSWIHIFSAVVIFNVPYAIWAIRRGDISGHRNAMIGLSLGGIGIAGFFAMQRGRLMWDILFTGAV
ncbi:MAG: DUF2306 domain-containing protein [Pseudomonadota bacterium]